MIFQSLKNLITSGDKRAMLKTMEIMDLQGRLIFYNAGLETGLLKLLETPSSLEQIARKLKIANRQLLSSLLDLGCSLKELSCKNGLYSLKGPMAKALIRNAPIAAMILETVRCHADIALRLDAYLRKNRKGDYLKDLGGIIAESSRILEPMIRAFIYHTVKRNRPLSILEFGCGAGEYLKYYVDINRKNGGMAIDLDASVVTIAQKNLKKNNIEENFSVMRDNILKPKSLKGQTFDLVTSYSNMHYFSGDERLRLFRAIHGLLNKNGRFMLATGFKSNKLTSSYYDLIFSAIKGLYPLPLIDDIAADMKKTGFSRVKIVNLLDDSFKGIVAYK
jgi:4-hydroxy-2,2'-bipyrrole-5-carbaldehyde O-methyltransferase